MLEHVYLIPLIPLAASLIILLGAREDPESPLPYLGIAGTFWCLIQSSAILWGAAAGSLHLPYEANWNWFALAAEIGGRSFACDVPIGVLIDGTAAVMLVMVSLVSLLVQVYSLGYMRGDPRLKRYFAFLSFFTAAMLGLVVSSSLLVLFACWELVGVSSYLLIGFWFEQNAPAYAAKKAFITTKLGDLGFFLALLLIYAKVGSFQLAQFADFVGRGYLGPGAAVAIGLGILSGAVGKSAQWPLFVWLPDAMEGPTPVSALIHAATMVAAGGYLIARCYFVFAVCPVAMEAVAWIGLVTALLAGTMALVAYDIKRVLAFSTIGQLGFMFCALGCGGYTSGLFHLVTHAFFKALLFLGAGSVIHAMRTNDMRSMGGLSKKMPATFLTMFVGACALSGLPPFSGFYSKDAILETVYLHSPVMFWLLLFAALLTAFYMFRLMFLTFLGDDRDHEKHRHAHESPAVMTWPLVILAFLSLVSGFALAHDNFFAGLVSVHSPGAGAEAAAAPQLMSLWVTLAVLGAVALSWLLYGRGDFGPVESLKARFLWLFRVLENRYGFDAFFLGLVAFCDKVSSLAFRLDSEVVDRVFVDGWGLLVRIFAELSNLADALLVDRTVDGFGGLSLDLGAGLRCLVAGGQVQEYLMYIAIGVSLFAVLILSR